MMSDFENTYTKELGKTNNGITYIVEFYDNNNNYLFTKIGCAKNFNATLNSFKKNPAYGQIVVKAIIYVKASEFKNIAKDLLHFYFTDRLYLNKKEIAKDSFILPHLDVMKLGSFIQYYNPYSRIIEHVVYFINYELDFCN